MDSPLEEDGFEPSVPLTGILRYLSKKDEAPKVQPEAVAAGFEDKRNPPDIAAGSDRLIRLGAGEVRISPTFLMS